MNIEFEDRLEQILDKVKAASAKEKGSRLNMAREGFEKSFSDVWQSKRNDSILEVEKNAFGFRATLISDYLPVHLQTRFNCSTSKTFKTQREAVLFLTAVESICSPASKEYFRKKALQ